MDRATRVASGEVSFCRFISPSPRVDQQAGTKCAAAAWYQPVHQQPDRRQKHLTERSRQMILDPSVDHLISPVSAYEHLLLFFDEIHRLGDNATHPTEPLANRLGA